MLVLFFDCKKYRSPPKAFFCKFGNEYILAICNDSRAVETI